MARFDRPLWKDPLFYLVVCAELSAIPLMKGGPIDAIVAIGFQFVLFGMIPTSIRKSARERRAK